MRDKLLHAYAPKSAGPVGSALRSLARFARTVPNRELFKHPSFTGDLAVEAYNEWTLLLFAWSESKRVSDRTKRLLKTKSIEQQVGLLKGFLSHRYGFQIVGKAPRLKSLLAVLKSADASTGQRAKRRGFRRRHFRKVWEQSPGLRAGSFAALNQWAAATSCWHVLARGGELELIKRSDLSFHVTGKGKKYARLMVTPLKKRGVEAVKVPQFITQQEGEEWGPYDALRRLAAADIWGKAPTKDVHLFRSEVGRPISTARMRGIFRLLAKSLGFDPKQFGAHSGRIGGATDLAASGNSSVPILLQAKGRWASDIGKIYARMTRRVHLAASDIMFRAKGRDLEEIMPEFTQQA